MNSLRWGKKKEMFTYKNKIVNLNMTFTFQQGERSKVVNGGGTREEEEAEIKDFNLITVKASQ